MVANKTNGSEIKTNYSWDYASNTFGERLVIPETKGPMYKTLRSIQKYQKNTNGGKK